MHDVLEGFFENYVDTNWIVTFDCVDGFGYLKDLSLALGQIGRIPLILSVWAPIIALSLFTFIGVLQINEK